MTDSAIATALQAVKDAVGVLESVLKPVTASVRRVVRAGESLQAALDAGGDIELEAATWEGTYTLPSQTRLTGRIGSAVHGLTGPALSIGQGVRTVSVSTVLATSKYHEVISVGENSSKQTTIDSAPAEIMFTDVTVPSHRGKRAFGIHGANVGLMNCSVLDCWDPSGQDSQAVYVGNTPGPIQIIGGTYSAGSEVILFGGDATKIPNVTPTNILIDGVEMYRPLSWKTDGVKRKIKNILEFKNGRQVLVKNCQLHGCWQEGQQGEAIVLTPTLDGALVSPPLQSGDVRDVTIQDCKIWDVASGFNIQGRAYSTFTPNALTNLLVQRVSLIASKALFGGRGQLALISGEPGSISFEAVTAIVDGTSLIYYSGGTVLDPVTKTSRPAGKMGSLSLTISKANLGSYGIMLNGSANAVNWKDSVETLTVTGNLFGGSTAMKNTLPGNTYQSTVFIN